MCVYIFFPKLSEVESDLSFTPSPDSPGYLNC